MARSFLLILAVMMFLLCIGIFYFNSSKDKVHDPGIHLPVNDVVSHMVHYYIQEQEKRLATLRQRTEDYLKEHEKEKRKVARALNDVTQESSANDDEEIKEKAVEANFSHLYEYADSEFNAICSEEISLPAYIQKKLKCRYVDRGIPFLKIAPFKEEEVYLDPRIVVYHEVIYEDEIKAIKGLAEPRLRSAKVGILVTGKVEVAKDRIGKSAELEDDGNKHLKLLSRRVEHMTGLTVDTAQSLQITYYDVGGLYFPHYDFVLEEYMHLFKQFRNGNRMATVLFYMNDVAEGGGTVFPALNFTLWPKKGSAVFWYNLKRNGEGDFLTWHGACPVLSGTKWIATRWLSERGQEFLRPCSLDENE